VVLAHRVTRPLGWLVSINATMWTPRIEHMVFRNFAGQATSNERVR
jgi:hypothetical protein